MANEKIKRAAKVSGVKLWEIAARFGVSDGQFSRWLRSELPEERREQALRFVDEIAIEHAKEVRA